MIRSLFRTALKLGLVAAIVAVIVRWIQSREPQPFVPATTSAGTTKLWPPLDVPESPSRTAGAAATAAQQAAVTVAPGAVQKTAAERAAKAAREATVAGQTAEKRASGTTASADSPAVAWVEPEGHVCPTSHPLKAKMASKIFHAPGGLSYDRTTPDRCYADADAAEADGLRAAKR